MLFSTVYRYIDSEWLFSYKILYRLHSVWLKFLILKKFQRTYNQHQLQLQFTHLSTLLAVFSNSHGLTRHGDCVWSGPSPATFPPRQQPGILVMLLEKPQILLPIILVLGSRHDHLPRLSTRHFWSWLRACTVRWLSSLFPLPLKQIMDGISTLPLLFWKYMTGWTSKELSKQARGGRCHGGYEKLSGWLRLNTEQAEPKVQSKGSSFFTQGAAQHQKALAAGQFGCREEHGQPWI